MTNPLKTAAKAADTLFGGIDQLLTGASVGTATFERMMQDVDFAHAARSVTYRATYINTHIKEAATSMTESDVKVLERMGKVADYGKLYTHNEALLKAAHGIK